MWVLSVKLTKLAPMEYYFVMITFFKSSCTIYSRKICEKGLGKCKKQCSLWMPPLGNYMKKGQVMLEQQVFSRSLFI